MIIDIKDLSGADKQHYLQHLIAPRPVCFASTINQKGEINLSPFSFFNLFSIDPPVVIFSPSRRVRDNTVKHTLENVKDVPEVVINIVDYDMVQQASLASCEYPRGVNEFEKAGFTMEHSIMVQPPMVKESKAKLECKVMEVISLGEKGGSGNLVLSEIMLLHIDESVLDRYNRVDQTKIHHIARLGGNWYCKVDSNNLFEVEKPNVKLGIGFDGLPDHIKNSRVLTGNQLGILANVESLPVAAGNFSDPQLKKIAEHGEINRVHQYAAALIDKGQIAAAWQVLLQSADLF
ncbi:MAG: flavin reductase family protein [Niabella sp.]